MMFISGLHALPREWPTGTLLCEAGVVPETGGGLRHQPDLIVNLDSDT